MSHTPDVDEQVNAAIRGMTERMSVGTGEDKEEIRPIIAAAPDMLEALEDVKNILDTYDPLSPLCSLYIVWSSVDAAIRKARGEDK